MKMIPIYQIWSLLCNDVSSSQIIAVTWNYSSLCLAFI